MFLIRVSLPDRPGALGAVASALGNAGADIQAVEIVGREFGRVVDDFIVNLPVGMMPDSAVSACTSSPGVQVLWCSRYPGGAGLESDVEVLERMLADPDNAAEILTEAAPPVFHCHWAVLVDASAGQVVHATPLAPDLDSAALDKIGALDECRTADLPAGWVPEWVETVIGVIPVGSDRAVVAGRHGGPDFLAAEMARLRYLATLISMA
ncbi:ACT domain-containing protein [Granulicoccus sp. GXG6511]|uniref:ACT domain-containing protein n=1 Tax=Granulicoccus sp. GXG6511 TaxID=3381351 RepID=UPI003D7EB2D0